MHTQDTSNSQTNGHIRFGLRLGGSFCIAGGLALLAMAATPAQGQETPRLSMVAGGQLR